MAKWFENENGAQQLDIGSDTLIITGKISATGRQAFLRVPNQIMTIKLHDCDPDYMRGGKPYPKRDLKCPAYKAKVLKLYEAYKLVHGT